VARNAVSRPTRDPEFDPEPVGGSRPTIDVVKYYQRLVVNPFLSVIAYAVAGLVISTFRDRKRLVPATWLIALVAGYYLIQFHCLDCGKTGMFHQWRRHACQSVLHRWQERVMVSSRFPTVSQQLQLWFLALGGGAFLLVSLQSR
jgi:hypothetical protein